MIREGLLVIKLSIQPSRAANSHNSSRPKSSPVLHQVISRFCRCSCHR